jgi:predicted DNA-binding transcriptional regulator AlpA
MININGKQYINDKEASKKYGYSQEWFKKRRNEKKPPCYIKFDVRGRVLYDVDEIDKWFQANLRRYEY